MKQIFVVVCVFVLESLATRAHGQNLYVDFATADAFSHAFAQKSSGIVLSWSATGGIDDNSGAAGGGVVSSGSGKVSIVHNGGPTFSLNDGLTYSISEFVQATSIGTSGDMLLGLVIVDKSVFQMDVPLIGVRLENTDGAHLAVAVIWQDPAKASTTPVVMTTQPALGDWIRLRLTIQETDVATGVFAYSVEVDDFGATGVGAATTLLGDTTGSFTDNLLGAKTASGWVPFWGTTVGGNAFDNLAVGISAGLGTLIVAGGDPSPGIPNAVFSVAGNPAINSRGSVAFQALVAGVGKNSGISAANNSGIWLYSSDGTGSLVAQTGRDSAPAPGTNGGAFSKLSDPLLSGTALGFFGKLIPGVGNTRAQNTEGIWTQGSGALGLYARTDQAAPGFPSGALISAISEFGLNDDGAAPIKGTAVGAGLNASNDIALWLPDSNGVLQLVAQSSQGFKVWTPQAYLAGQSRSVDCVNGYGAAILKYNQEFTAIGLATPYGLASAGASGFDETYAIRGGDPAPGFIGAPIPAVKSLGLPAVNSQGALAFTFTMQGAGVKPSDDLGIGLITTAGSSLVAQTGAGAAAGTSAAIYSALSAPVLNNANDVAFVGGLVPGVGDTTRNGANAQGIWSNSTGSMELLARKGDAAPGGGIFSNFNQIVLTDSETVIFEASLSGAPSYTNQGIWYGYGNSVFLVTRAGALVPVGGSMKTIKALKIFPLAPYSMGQTRSFAPTGGDFVYTATFTDGTWAIFVVLFA